jgi:cytochrome o ubiquinol oxidase subunit 1
VVWHIWWLVVVCALSMWVVVIARIFDDDAEYRLPAAEVEKIERQRYQALESAARSRVADNPYFAAQRLQESVT